MNYSLGNMLGGAGALNADKLALNLQFATDKTLTARKGPTPTFTRASGATQVGASGLIEFAPENLLLQSENFGTTWTAGQLNVTGTPPYLNVATAPNGTTTAEKLIANTTNSTHQFRQDVTLVGGNTYTISAYYKAQETNFATISIVGVANGSADWVAYFNISASSPAVGFFNGFTSTAIVDVGDGWRRCSVTFTTTASGSLNTRFGGASSTTFNSNFYTGDNTSGFLIWGAQLEAHPTARTYIPTTTAAVYGARFDHDPITLACKGLLIEESRTNSLQHSANFKNTTSSSYWENQTTTSVTVDQTTSPDGGNNADLLVTSTTSFDCYSRRAVGYTGSTQYTYSIFLKQGPSSHRYVGLYIGVGITALQFPFFDFNNPTVVQIPSGTMTGTINSTRVDAYPNGWYRVSVTFTAAATPVTNYAGVYISTSNGTLASSSTAGLNAYIWGIQLELGAFPTSYIPTTTASVVRSADICSISGSAFSGMYNQPEGTLFADATPQTVAQLSSVLVVNTLTSNNQNGIYKLNAAFAAAGLRWGATTVISGATAEAAIATSTDVATSRAKLSYSYKLNDFAFAYAGAIVGTDSSGVVPSPTVMHIGNRDGSLQINGHIASVRFYKKRLANAKLQALTA